MRFKLKLQNKPLFIQIWIILGIILIGFSSLIVFIMPFVLRHSFTKETYARIEDHQEFIMKYHDESFSPIKDLSFGNSSGDKKDDLTKSSFEKKEHLPPPPPSQVRKNSDQSPFPFRMIEHVVLNSNNIIEKKIGRKELSPDFLNAIKKDILKQEVKSKKYLEKFNDNMYFYVIRQINLKGEDGYLVSYLKGKYRDNLVRDTFFKLIKTIIFVLLISWIASIFIARYLTRPLIRLQKRVKEISKNNWDTSVKLKRNDEIGQLAETINWMRKRLVEQNKKQQSFLQQVSHELKTPVMVIKSYIQSIKDGIFPKGDLQNSLETINDETIQLEKRIRSLLDLTKIDHLSYQGLEREYINFAKIVQKKVDIFEGRRSDLEWELDLEPVIINVDQDKISAVLENIFDNQIRYAKKKVKIRLRKRDRDEDGLSVLLLQIWNDGPPISSEVMKNLFKKYKKGNDGDFGLGLALVKVIVELHQGKVGAVNEKDGVSFYISLPLD